MAVHYLLDTNTVSYVIKGNFPRVRERLLKVPMAEVGISVITEAELRFGLARRPEASKLKIAVEEFLLRVEILAWDSEAAQHYARVRAALDDEGEPIGNMDLMIAAQALAAEALLVTHDRVFRRVKGLQIEDWTKP
jgi:tRNA(fMet)-specific endonuclease VapC